MFFLLPLFASSQPSMQHTGTNAQPPPWGIPVEIPIPANARGQPPTPWDRLHFSPIGAYHLRCWQGVFPGVRNFFIASQAWFRSADMAWFCSGSSRDSNHIHPQVSFHPSLVTLVRDTSSYTQGKAECKALLAEVKELMFDAVCLSSNVFCHDKTNHLSISILLGYDVRSVNRQYVNDYLEWWDYSARFSHARISQGQRLSSTCLCCAPPRSS
jgi:hypothetical protein